ncbi:MAG: uracil-DNA glycosylase [Phycisphaerales bacterium]
MAQASDDTQRLGMTMMHEPTDHLRRVARQHLETDRLLGVDFVPIKTMQPPPVAVTHEIEVTGPPGAAAPAAKPRVAASLFQAVARAQSAPRRTPQEKADALEALRTRHDETCPHCTTATAHTQTVFGEGAPDAELMFIGEAPGEQEDRTGRPFVGRAGRKLDEIIQAMGLARPDVYIANVLKSRPPANRTPLPTEVEQCAAFLAEQIRIIQPKVIVGLGGPAVKWLLGTNVGITRLRGQWDTFTDAEVSVPVMPTFHPAYLLRNYTPDTRGKVWSDMQQVIAYLRPAST